MIEEFDVVPRAERPKYMLATNIANVNLAADLLGLGLQERAKFFGIMHPVRNDRAHFELMLKTGDAPEDLPVRSEIAAAMTAELQKIFGNDLEKKQNWAQEVAPELNGVTPTKLLTSGNIKDMELVLQHLQYLAKSRTDDAQ